MSRRIWWAVLCGVFAAGPAAAQVAQPQAPLSGKVETGIKYRLSLMGSYGLDLDLFGEVLAPGSGDDLPLRAFSVDKFIAFPEVYPSTPRRQIVTLGFGVFQKDEIIVRVSRSTYAAAPAIVGELFTAEGGRSMTASFSNYKDETREIGLRHYFKATRPMRSYINIIGGERKMDALSAGFAAPGPLGNLGTLRLYDAAKLRTYGLEFGVTYEWGHVGLYVETGVRYTKRMKRQDEDLFPFNFQGINSTTNRIFMPANFGLVFRL